MPFYEYECQACKFYTEVMQKITDTPLIRCPSCGKRSLKKLLSAPVFRLKGGGWYETDFKSDKEKQRNLHGAEKEEPAAAAKAEGAEGKPAAQEAKDAKPADAKPADAKPATPKTAAGGSAGTSTRNRVSVSAKAARAAAARKPTRASRGKGARRRRR
ncbi:MAG: zinc ribbon domain-containing protein [Gammaproteobacteria bacterium]|nr:MAG: zinc ribbon domain-containing protein [Gammaproteobacteria bacterium]